MRVKNGHLQGQGLEYSMYKNNLLKPQKSPKSKRESCMI